MSDVAVHPLSSRTFIPLHAATTPAQRSATERAPRNDALRCTSCSMRPICMPQGLRPEELQRIEALICPSRTIRQGETIYRADDAFQSIYAVRAGSFKTVVMHRDGREHVTGFHLAGDSLGLDGVCFGRHSCDAVALEDSKVCIIPFHPLETMCREVKVLQQHVHRMMGGEIVRESSQMMLLGTMSAEQRVATFLLNLSERLRKRGYSPAEFHLRMTREEIGSYLGIKLETVSRMLSRFQREGLLDAQGKNIRILDHEGLMRV
ncbi:fumarate/nitrate reduction transcriptional regulator Fnr [bacterium M00.F.Ca.ET.228.01.1.1]|uniref:fumarate/nitrate reduction transcriptional regulator Fnr n=2 Tax=Pseudomonadota TaxID=1224 RepID=UPI001091AEF2|nr:fumarate/nitrate reduction transcriptional regulator Fnr [Paraburkholderia phenoliruptrix]TGP42633.1 fumarate/nitrate reduction transcriptional regulator Fnr [bacterium M00.F.Ca.ET.228.01.1.1]TGR95358.1 fumarate/nitrate reduction transcriptional regulator Fnr [bacterium M00.F.Ca.ET.191.01.1.1]TGT96247.1 fumarate/nitrate reduction transcriptional regulator Fnr [bacterium M00.F.Ca.ET.155.01.1.1]MBW0447662.1 fumarate/nitrate reduction transcriptional regulator Fnr [Paraburkholderia phenoliruptr